MRKSVVVVGSGLAGSMICNELAANANVTLLELGGENSISYPSVEYVHRELAGVRTFCHGGGGTTNLWHNGLIPINPSDVQSAVFRDVLSAARPYMDKAAARLFFPTSHFGQAYADAVAEVTRLGEAMGVFEYGLDCLVYPRKYTRLRADAGVRGHYNVRSLEFGLRGREITRVTFADGKGQHEVAADVVVICAGTLGTPRLVERIVSATGSSGQAAGVGLIDHPLGFVGKAKFKPQHCASMRTLSRLDKGDYECCTAARIKSSCGRYTCFAFFRPAMTMTNDLAIYKYKSLLGASSGAERIHNAFSPKILHPDILAEIFAHLFGVQPRGRVFNILVYFEQKRGDNRVTYAGDRLRVAWRITDQEIAVYNEMLGRLRDMLVPLADELNIQIPVSGEWLWSGAHHSGTVSLGNDPEDILDTDLRMKCCDNAFVCDGSVIQEHSYANTGLTIGQLALRLADHICAVDR